MAGFTYEGPRWPDQAVTWAFATMQYVADAAEPFSHFIGAGAVQATVAKAFATWAAVSGLQFRQVEDAGPANAPDIRIGFGAFGPAATNQLGETNYRYRGSSFASDVVVRIEDPSETPFVVKGSDFMIGGYSATVLQVALHEIGHALGLGHATSAGDVMYGIASAANRGLGASDIEGIRALYPAATAAPVLAAPSSLPSVALHGGHGDYLLALVFGSQFYVQDTVAGRDGTRTLGPIATLAFTDGTAVLDPTGTVADVARLYQAAFDRAPDLAGLLANAAQVTQGSIGLAGLAAAFIASPEFTGRYGQPDTAGFVTGLYQNVLHRMPDAGGMQSWTAMVGATSRGAALVAMADSAENRRQTLATIGDRHDAEATRLYRAAFNRAPDVPGLTAASDALRHGAAIDGVAQGFVGSGEFARAYGALSDDAFVAQLYQNVLHRSPDAAGKQDWLAQIGNGSSRAHVLAGFADSNENRITTAAATHDAWVFLAA